MEQVLHRNARTTDAIRRAIQRSEASVRALAPIKETEASASLNRNADNNCTLARRDAVGWCARATVRQRPSDKARGEDASGSVQKRRTLKERAARDRVRP